MTDKKSTADLQAELDALQTEAAEIKAEMPGVFDGSIGLPQDRKASEATEEEIARAQVLRDPWDTTNALKILAEPPGKVLRWISPAYRANGRGMRGWTPVRYDDAIGRELDLYIPDPPSRMQGMVDLGDVVRRGDVILCWLDEGIYRKRRHKNDSKTNDKLRAAAGHKNKPFGKHGSTYGAGLRDDEDPDFREPRPAPGFVSKTRMDEQQVQDRYRKGGKVPGRSMFSRPDDN